MTSAGKVQHQPFDRFRAGSEEFDDEGSFPGRPRFFGGPQNDSVGVVCEICGRKARWFGIGARTPEAGIGDYHKTPMPESFRI